MRKLSFAAPFLVAILTVVSLYQANADRLDPGQMLAPLVFSLIVAALFALIFWLCQWTARHAPWVASLFTFCFLMWSVLPWQANVFLLLLVSLFAIIYQSLNTTTATNLLSAVLILAIIVSGVMAFYGQAEASPVSASYIYKSGQPNIYFIIPDRMPGPAAMRESGINPDQAVAPFRDLGFYVNENQLSTDPYTVDYEGEVHTTRTMRFLASVLNDGAVIPMDISYKDCRGMIKNNNLFTRLHSKGYKVVNVASWFSETAKFPEADENLTYENVGFLERLFQDELSVAYFERTVLNGLNFRVFESDNMQRDVETGRFVWQVFNIDAIASRGRTSTFVFAHILAPHEPYIFSDTRLSIPEQYNQSIEGVLARLVGMARQIRNHDPTAIIVIQSDEGMAYRKPIELNYELSPVQWSGVFTAWYIPGFEGDFDSIKHTEILLYAVPR